MALFALRRKKELGVCKKIENFVISNFSFSYVRHGFIVFFRFFFFFFALFIQEIET